MRATEQPQRVQIALWVLVMALFLGASLAAFDSFQVGVYQDDASYVILAHSLVSSTRYGMLNTPDTPAPALFPFGFPLFLSPFAHFFPTQPDLMRWVSLAATLLNGILLFWHWRTFSPGTSYWWGLSVTALYLLSPLTIAHSRMVMSEAVFTLLVLGTLLVVSRMQFGKIEVWQSILTSILLVFVVFVRTIGIILLASIFLYWLITYRRRALIPILEIVLGMVLVTAILVAITPIEPIDLVPARYVRELETVSDKPRASDSPKPSVFYNLFEYITADLREVVLPFGSGASVWDVLRGYGLAWLMRVFGLSVTLVIALGGWIWYRREGLRLPLFFGVLYFLTLGVWTWPLPRLLYPVQPQLFLSLLLGLATIASFVARRITARPLVKYAAAAPGILLLLGMDLYVNARAETSRAEVGDLAERTAWIREHTSSDAVLLTQYPQIDFIYSDRKTLAFNSPLPPSTRMHNVYVLVTPHLEWRHATDPRPNQIKEQMRKQIKALEEQHAASLVFQDPVHQIFVYQLVP